MFTLGIIGKCGVLALALWLGGLNCLASCMAELDGMQPASDTSQECTDQCCKREPGKGEDSTQPEPHHPTDGMNCCPFLNASPATTASKLKFVTSATDFGSAPPDVPSLAVLVGGRETILEFADPTDPGDIYLRHRVLRI